MHRSDCRGAKIFEGEIPRGHRIEGIAHGMGKAKRTCRQIAVDRKRGTRQCGGSERAFVHPLARVFEASSVARIHLDISQAVMTEGDGLRRLKMREAGHDRIGVLFGLVEEHALQRNQSRLRPLTGAADPEPEIGGNLIVARARRVQPARYRSDHFDKPGFDVEVNVFQDSLESETAFLDVGTDLCQSVENAARIILGNDPLRGQHRDMRTRAFDIFPGQPLVEIYGDVDLLHDICGTAPKSRAPHLIRHHGPAMPFLRLRTLIALGLLLLAVAGSVLYVIHARSVHAPLTAPAELARLQWDAPQPVPAVAFAGGDGTRSTPASFAGHYVLLNLWATWCAPCVGELPQLAALQSRLPALKVVAVNVGRGSARQTAAFLKSHGAAGLAVYIDPDAALIGAFNAPGLPETILIDPQGREIAHALGPCDWAAPAAADYLLHVMGVPRS